MRCDKVPEATSLNPTYVSLLSHSLDLLHHDARVAILHTSHGTHKADVRVQPGQREKYNLESIIRLLNILSARIRKNARSPREDQVSLVPYLSIRLQETP